MNPDDMLDVIDRLGGGRRIVTGTELRAAMIERGIFDPAWDTREIKKAEEAEAARPSPRFLKWKSQTASDVGFTLANAAGPFQGWRRW